MYRPDLPELPPRMRKLPLDARGYPVPWFVAFIDGKPDFRVIRENGVPDAHNHRLCWLCGEKRGTYQAFVVGPMCGINRVSAEPPAHLECAEYAVRACPFLTRPLAERSKRDMPEHQAPAGVMIERNPGVALLWVTKTYRPFRASAEAGGRAGVLFRLGDPTRVEFWAKGRRATRAEVDHSVATGIHLLEGPATAEGDEAVRELARLRRAFDALLLQACGAAG